MCYLPSCIAIFSFIYGRSVGVLSFCLSLSHITGISILIRSIAGLDHAGFRSVLGICISFFHVHFRHLVAMALKMPTKTSHPPFVVFQLQRYSSATSFVQTGMDPSLSIPTLGEPHANSLVSVNRGLVYYWTRPREVHRYWTKNKGSMSFMTTEAIPTPPVLNATGCNICRGCRCLPQQTRLVTFLCCPPPRSVTILTSTRMCMA